MFLSVHFYFRPRILETNELEVVLDCCQRFDNCNFRDHSENSPQERADFGYSYSPWFGVFNESPTYRRVFVLRSVWNKYKNFFTGSTPSRS